MNSTRKKIAAVVPHEGWETIDALEAIVREEKLRTIERCAFEVEHCEYDASEPGMSIGYIAGEVRALAAKYGPGGDK